MPTRVLRHVSHSVKGKRIVVRTFTRYGPEHTAEWKRLVLQLQQRGNVRSPEAVATAIIEGQGRSPFLRRRR
jgi:hypothetical protein